MKLVEQKRLRMSPARQRTHEVAIAQGAPNSMPSNTPSDCNVSAILHQPSRARHIEEKAISARGLVKISAN